MTAEWQSVRAEIDEILAEAVGDDDAPKLVVNLADYDRLKVDEQTIAMIDEILLEALTTLREQLRAVLTDGAS